MPPYSLQTLKSGFMDTDMSHWNFKGILSTAEVNFRKKEGKKNNTGSIKKTKRTETEKLLWGRNQVRAIPSQCRWHCLALGVEWRSAWCGQRWGFSVAEAVRSVWSSSPTAEHFQLTDTTYMPKPEQKTHPRSYTSQSSNGKTHQPPSYWLIKMIYIYIYIYISICIFWRVQMQKPDNAIFRRKCQMASEAFSSELFIYIFLYVHIIDIIWTKMQN